MAVRSRRVDTGTNGLRLPPASADAERFFLGSILLLTNDAMFPEDLAYCFAIERHRRIYRCMLDLRARGEPIDYVTVYQQLASHGAHRDDLSFLIDLPEGIPFPPNLNHYAKVLREVADRRKLVSTLWELADRAALRSENLDNVVAAGVELFDAVAARQTYATGQTYRSIDDIPTIAESTATKIEYIRPELPRGAVVALTGDSASGKSTLATAWARDGFQNKGIPFLFLDRENPLTVVADRIARLGLEEGPGRKFWGGWLGEQAPQPDSPIVRAFAKEHKGLIVIDSFTAFVEGDQNDASVVRGFMHRCRRLADLGATSLVIHHDGKAEIAKDYRGSSDFKAAIDIGFHVTNSGVSRQLDNLVLRPYKTRFGGFSESVTYRYAGGKVVRGEAPEASQTVSEQLTTILRLNPGIRGKQFEELARDRNIGRDRAREFLFSGLKAGTIWQETGSKNLKRYYLTGTEAQGAL